MYHMFYEEGKNGEMKCDFEIKKKNYMTILQSKEANSRYIWLIWPLTYDDPRGL